jgi:4,5-DOPA dioxygenase extradiol
MAPAFCPAVFIGHGSPMNALADNAYTRGLRALGRRQARPEAIVVVSAHWTTEGSRVTAQDDPEQIYDFYGFPRELYEVRYPCRGSARWAGRIARDPGFGVAPSSGWGIDHAAWAVLVHLFPDADIPVLEISLDAAESPAGHLELGRRLRPLRRENILVIGSGNVVHNLGRMKAETDAEPFAWAVRAQARIRRAVADGSDRDLTDFPGSDADALAAAPTLEHFLPALTIAGMRQPGEPACFHHEGIQNGSVSMLSWSFGGDG